MAAAGSAVVGPAVDSTVMAKEPAVVTTGPEEL